MELSEEEKINRLLNSIAKGCDGNIADEVKAIIIKQQKEIEEKTTILLAGAEKVKQLEKEIEDLNEIKQQICNEELIIQDYVQDNFITKDKIRAKIKELEEQMQQDEVDEFGIHSISWGTLDYAVEVLQGLLCDGCEFGAEDYDNCIGCENDE